MSFSLSESPSTLLLYKIAKLVNQQFLTQYLNVSFLEWDEEMDHCVKIEDAVLRMLKWWRDRNPSNNTVKDFSEIILKLRTENVVTVMCMKELQAIIQGRCF